VGKRKIKPCICTTYSSNNRKALLSLIGMYGPSSSHPGQYRRAPTGVMIQLFTKHAASETRACTYYDMISSRTHNSRTIRPALNQHPLILRHVLMCTCRLAHCSASSYIFYLIYSKISDIIGSLSKLTAKRQSEPRTPILEDKRP